jgi:hypothetical protein
MQPIVQDVAAASLSLFGVIGAGAGDLLAGPLRRRAWPGVAVPVWRWPPAYAVPPATPLVARQASRISLLIALLLLSHLEQAF